MNKEELKLKFSKGKIPTEADFAALIDGVEGPQGPQGPAGAKGAKGDPGKDGFGTKEQFDALVARVEALEAAE